MPTNVRRSSASSPSRQVIERHPRDDDVGAVGVDRGEPAPAAEADRPDQSAFFDDLRAPLAAGKRGFFGLPVWDKAQVHFAFVADREVEVWSRRQFPAQEVGDAQPAVADRLVKDQLRPSIDDRDAQAVAVASAQLELLGREALGRVVARLGDGAAGQCERRRGRRAPRRSRPPAISSQRRAPPPTMREGPLAEQSGSRTAWSWLPAPVSGTGAEAREVDPQVAGPAGPAAPLRGGRSPEPAERKGGRRDDRFGGRVRRVGGFEGGGPFAASFASDRRPRRFGRVGVVREDDEVGGRSVPPLRLRFESRSRRRRPCRRREARSVAVRAFFCRRRTLFLFDLVDRFGFFPFRLRISFDRS